MIVHFSEFRRNLAAKIPSGLPRSASGESNSKYDNEMVNPIRLEVALCDWLC